MYVSNIDLPLYNNALKISPNLDFKAMKKFLLMAVMALISVSYASAQWKTYYVLEQVGEEYPGQSFFKIDWNNKRIKKIKVSHETFIFFVHVIQ